MLFAHVDSVVHVHRLSEDSCTGHFLRGFFLSSLRFSNGTHGQPVLPLPGLAYLLTPRVPCRYVRSLDSSQLGGDNSTSSACDPIRYVNGGSSNTSLPNGGRINPCGLIAWSNFNDTFAAAAGGRPLAIDVSIPHMPPSQPSLSTMEPCKHQGEAGDSSLHQGAFGSSV